MNKLTIIIPLGKDRKLEALESIKRQTIPVETIIERGANPSSNRNRGIKKAKSPLAGFINAHTILPEDWAARVVNFFESHPEIDVVGGPQLTPKNESFIGKASGYALSSVFGAAVASARYKPQKIMFDADERILTSANLACRKKVFKKINFDESLYPGEDPKFISDAKRSGFKIAYSPEIYVYHRRRASIREFARQIFNYGVTRPKKESFKETLKHPSFLIPPIFTIYIPLSLILYNFNTLFAYPLILYAVTNILFSLYECIKNKDIKVLPVLPLLFFIIHISYGIGFIYGSF